MTKPIKVRNAKPTKKTLANLAKHQATLESDPVYMGVPSVEELEQQAQQPVPAPEAASAAPEPAAKPKKAKKPKNTPAAQPAPVETPVAEEPPPTPQVAPQAPEPPTTRSKPAEPVKAKKASKPKPVKVDERRKVQNERSLEEIRNGLVAPQFGPNAFGKYLEQLWLQTKEPLDQRAIILAQIADAQGMTPKGAASKETEEAVIIHATNLTRHYDERFKDRVAKHNAKLQPAPTAEEQAIANLPKRERSKKLKQIAKRKEEAAKAKAKKPVKKAKKEGASTGSTRYALFTFPVTAVLRWMGLNGWDYDEAQKAMDHYKLEVAIPTIRAQLAAGKKGERGPAAELSKAQEQELNGIIAKPKSKQSKEKQKPNKKK